MHQRMVRRAAEAARFKPVRGAGNFDTMPMVDILGKL
jgi:hypothetical protein